MRTKSISIAAKKTPRLRGSYTVEAALIFQVVLLVLIYVLLTDEYLADSARMTALLAERAWQLADGEESGNIRKDSPGFFRLHGEKISERVSKKRVQVACRDTPRPAYFVESYDVELRINRRQPVKWLWRMRQLQAGLE